MLTSDIDLRLPYISADLPGIGGVLRATPDHFVVEEVPLYPATGEGQHLYVNITKVGLTTKDVQAQLARLFKLSQGEVGYAGMKDKQARTTQTFSLNVGHHAPAFAAEAATQIATELPVTVNWASFHKNKLRPGHLLGNRFTITVTALALPAAEAQERATAIVELIQAQGLPNFYGPQRLGADGNNVRQGLALLRGELEKRDRWLRRFLISAFQSYLCNRYLARRVERGAFDHLLAGDVAKKYATGGMFDVADVEVEQPRYADKEISFTAPMYGTKLWAAQGAAGELEAEVLAESQISMDDLARSHVEGTRRLGRLLLPDLETTASPDGLIISFMLPKGAFATTVLRELMKVDVDALNVVEDADEEL